MSDIQVTNLILENDILFSTLVEKVGILEAINLFKLGIEHAQLSFDKLYENLN